MGFTDEYMEELAEFAKLDLSKDDMDKLKKDLGDLLDKIKSIKKVDTKGIEPMISLSANKNIYREDIVDHKNLKENQYLALKNAPDKRDDFIVVPKILE